MAAAKEEEAQSIVDPVYKTKIVEFLGRTTPIVLQNENGPCPLLAICNVLLLRNVINLSVDEPEVTQQRLLSLVAERLIDSNSNVEGKDESYVNNQEQNIADAIDLLPRLATGIDVNMHFGKINDFEFTRECAIFDLLDIALYHGWIVDPQDAETSSAIGSKSYNTLADELVHKISEKEKSNRSNVDFDRRKDEEDDETIDFAAATTAALGVPCPSLSRGLSFDNNQKGKGDLEEDEEVSRILDLSKSEKLEPVSESSEIINPGFEKVENSNSESNIFAIHKNETDTENNEVVAFPTLILEDSSTSLDMDQLVTDKSVIEKTGEEQLVERSGEESVEFSNGLGVVDDEPIYQGEEYILNHNNSSRALMCESPEPVYEGEVVLAEQLKDSPDDHQWVLVRNFLESNASQLTIYGLFCLQEGLKERELCVFFRNNHFSTMFKYNGELYLLATDQGYILQPDLVWEKLNEVNGDTVFMTGNFTQFKAENRGNDSWNEQQAMTSTADYLAALGSTDPSVSVTNSDLQYAIQLQQQEFEQQEEEQRIRQQQQQNRQQQQQNRHQPQPPQPHAQQPYPTPPPGSNRSRLVIGPQNTPRPAQNQTQRTGETKMKDKCIIM